MSHTVDQTTTDYIRDVAAGLPVVLQDGTNTHVYGLDLISATDDQDAQTYFTYDGLGSVTDLTDDEGDVVVSYTYDVFGKASSGTLIARCTTSAPATTIRPSAGSWGGTRRGLATPYGYGANNPVRFVDPSGLCAPGITCPPGMERGRGDKEGCSVRVWQAGGRLTANPRGRTLPAKHFDS